ncbi:MAG TPA: HD domain-containing phosphohydrolase [Fimbriimonadaceae bacterium]|jgi:diguanylate cyclase (GGDEF)-like protein
MNSSLQTKIKTLILLPLMLLCGVAVISFIVLTKKEIAERTKSDVRATTTNVKVFLDEKVKHLAMETGLLSEVPYIKGAALSGDAPTVQDELNTYGKLLNGDGMMLFGSENNLLGASGPLKNASSDIAKQLGMDGAMDSKPWSGIVETPYGLVLVATAHLMVGSYSKGAVVCYSCINNQVASELSRLLSTEIVFIDNGKQVATSAVIPTTSFSTSQPNYVESQGVQLVGLYAPLQDGKLGIKTGIVALRSVDEIIGPSRVLLFTFLLVLGFALCITAWIANRFARGLAEPLTGVIAAASAMERGEWPEPLTVKSKDEIGMLQTVFNKMSSSLQSQQERLKAMIDLDPLTELPNHRRFKQILESCIVSAQERHKALSVLIFDIDKFSDYNKSEGFGAGDEALISLANHLRERCPEDCFVARYGGEEFALILTGSTLQGANDLGDGIRASFAAKMSTGLTISGGCAEMAASTEKTESLCLAAELALVQAKQLGRNQVCDFNMVSEDGGDPFELNRFLQDGTIATIQALAAAVDAKDPYTKGHSQRVAEYAADLCRYVGGSESEVELVFRTGTLHDVGKIGVPDSILKKEGPLTPEERAIMETHSVLGETIVKKVPQLRDTLGGVRHHHERWDGKGYPDNLVGTNIPYLGQLLAVADTFDAMTSDRPYRKGLPVEIALAEIKKNAGIQFEPTLAEAFVEMMAASSQAKAA